MGLGGNESARVSGYDNALQRLIEEIAEEEASGIVASLGKEWKSHNMSFAQQKRRAGERAEAEAEAVRQNAASSTIARRVRTRNEQNRPPVSPTIQPRLGGQDDQVNTPDDSIRRSTRNRGSSLRFPNYQKLKSNTMLYARISKKRIRLY